MSLVQADLTLNFKTSNESKSDGCQDVFNQRGHKMKIRKIARKNALILLQKTKCSFKFFSFYKKPKVWPRQNFQMVPSDNIHKSIEKEEIL